MKSHFQQQQKSEVILFSLSPIIIIIIIANFFSLPSFINLYVLSFVICCLWSHLVSISSSDNKTKKNENVQCFLTRLVGVKHIHKEFFFRCCRYSFENCFAKNDFSPFSIHSNIQRIHILRDDVGHFSSSTFVPNEPPPPSYRFVFSSFLIWSL